MFSGTFHMGDCILTFCLASDNVVSYSVTDPMTYQSELRDVPAAAFSKALAIAVHWDGMPEFERDYPDAKSVQPTNPALRWIP